REDAKPDVGVALVVDELGAALGPRVGEVALAVGGDVGAKDVEGTVGHRRARPFGRRLAEDGRRPGVRPRVLFLEAAIRPRVLDAPRVRLAGARVTRTRIHRGRAPAADEEYTRHPAHPHPTLQTKRRRGSPRYARRGAADQPRPEADARRSRAIATARC